MNRNKDVTKPWRIATRKEFYIKANKILDKIIDDLYNRLGDSKFKEINDAREKLYVKSICNIDIMVNMYGSANNDKVIKEKVNLKINVIVRNNWRDENTMLINYGYDIKAI